MRYKFDMVMYRIYLVLTVPALQLKMPMVFELHAQGMQRHPFHLHLPPAMAFSSLALHFFLCNGHVPAGMRAGLTVLHFLAFDCLVQPFSCLQLSSL